jgi:hypothetical protein
MKTYERLALPPTNLHASQISFRHSRRSPSRDSAATTSKTYVSPTQTESAAFPLREHSLRHDLRILGWCLIGNHVHLIAIPGAAESMPLALGGAHSRYMLELDRQHHWGGCLSLARSILFLPAGKDAFGGRTALVRWNRILFVSG